MLYLALSKAGVVDIHTVQPIDKELLIKCAKTTGAVVTVEEHSIKGGLGSAVAEVLSEHCLVPVGFMGLEEFAESGDYEQLLDKYSLNGNAVAEKCQSVLSKK